MTDVQRAEASTEGSVGGAFTTRMLKAMAHPLRRRILRELARLGVRGGRAADLAVALDEPANSLSFHLRTLADADLIREAPALARDRRDRVWVRVADGPANVGGPGTPTEDRELAGAVAAALIGDVHELLERIGRRAATGDFDVLDRDAMLVLSLRHLTPDQFVDLTRRMNAVLDEYLPAGDESPSADASFYEIVVAMGSEHI